MIVNAEDYAYFEHFGVKGMHWGVRNDRKSSRTPEQQAKRKANIKKAAIAGAVVVVAAAATAGAIYAKKHMGTSVSDVAKSTKSAAGKKAAEHIAKEPTSLIHASRSKHDGFKFLKSGGLDDPMQEYTKGFGTSDDIGTFKRYGSPEKIAADFLDVKGRRDAAGRVIPHQIIVPHHLTEGVNSLDDVKSKIWPMLEKDYDAFFEKGLTPLRDR